MLTLLKIVISFLLAVVFTAILLHVTFIAIGDFNAFIGNSWLSKALLGVGFTTVFLGVAQGTGDENGGLLAIATGMGAPLIVIGLPIVLRYILSEPSRLLESGALQLDFMAYQMLGIGPYLILALTAIAMGKALYDVSAQSK